MRIRLSPTRARKRKILEALQPTEKERSLIVDNAKLLLIGEFMDAYGYEKTFENEKFVIFE